MKLGKVSIVVMTHNRKVVLEKTLKAMLKLDYPTNYEIIVVNDGSTDGTKTMLKERFSKENKIKVINQVRSLPCKARNNGIRAAKYPFIAIMDDDCVPNLNWLKDLMKGFMSEKIGVVSAFTIYGGTSTVFRRSVLDKVGLYDEEYGYYREDTDLVFRILDVGYETKLVKAKFSHEHKIEAPKGFTNFLRHALERVRYHVNDVLLYKKHPIRAKEFLDIKFGFIRNPTKDFEIATGLWWEKGKFALSSPRGIVFLENETPLHFLLIIFGALSYVIAVKIARLYGSVKFGKLLI